MGAPLSGTTSLYLKFTGLYKKIVFAGFEINACPRQTVITWVSYFLVLLAQWADTLTKYSVLPNINQLVYFELQISFALVALR